MKYLITGLTGFAGPHLARELLDAGHEVAGLIRGSNGREDDIRDVLDDDHFRKIEWIYGDLKDLDSMDRLFVQQRFDGVYHLAAQSHPPTSFSHPIGTFADNVMGSIHLIESLRKHQKECRFMFCSTSEVYGDTCKDLGVLSETSPLLPSNPYGNSKAAVDFFVQERCKNKFLDGYITRAFSHTGPRRGRRFSISSDAYQLARMKIGLEKNSVLRVGNLQTKRVVIDVRDCVHAYVLLMDKATSGEAYNVGGSDVHPMQYYTDLLIEVSGLTGVTQEVDSALYRPIDIQVQIPDTTKLRTATGWEPRISLEQAMQDLFDYWVRKLTP
ncbi:MAG: GDPmannose 4,6-dehydratase [Candidatus Peregrinibacteria bacterium Greene0416_19]|nr:MAG: GDPmannose 4,6-dehydratase [Candidatus Peregrinibacteria bacterium Greene0416_19]